MDRAEHDPVGEIASERFSESLLVELFTQFISLPSERIDSAIDDALHRLCQRFDLDRSTLWQCSDRPGALFLTHITQPETWPKLTEPPEDDLLATRDWVLNAAKEPPIYRSMQAKAFFPWIFEQVQCGRTIVLSSLDDLPPTAALDREVFRKFGTLSTVVVPLRVGKELLGCVSFASMRAERRWSASLVKHFELAANLFAYALARKSFELAHRANQDILHAVLDNAVEGIITIDSRGIIESANFAATRIFGYQSRELIGQSIRMLLPSPFKERHEKYLGALLASRMSKTVRRSRERIALRKDGSTFPMELAVSESVIDGRRTFTGLIRDVTEKKKFESSLRESEARFQSIADSAPVLIWMSGLDKKCTFFNKPWLDFRGRSLEQEMGDGWVQGVHPEDLMTCLKTYEEAFDGRSSFVMQYRLRRHDGQFRWVSDCGVPLNDPEGRFIGYVGSCADITERVEAEQAMRDFSGRLIDAQEEERARVARELHDDVSQRLARLAIDVGRIQSASAHHAGADDLMSGVRDELVRLSNDVHNISYELHPSVLVDLGLDEALRSECDRLSKRAAVPIHVKLHHLPEGIPQDVAIGFFRIAQEALHNAIRHGHAASIEVTLRGLDEGIQLAVRDDGIGFDPSRKRHRPSLGLVGMKERVLLLGGELDVESELRHGTTIVAWVPLKEKNP